MLTQEEIRRFLPQAKEEGCYEIFLLELMTGLRRGEICALQWDDLNFDTGELHITKQAYRTKTDGLLISQPKTKASIRTILLPPAMVTILRKYRETVDSRWMFPSPVKEDMPLDPAGCSRRLHTILEHAGCKQVRFHDLRHTFATTALGNGMDAKALSAMLNHVSSSTTLNIYAQVTNEMRQSVAAKIDRGIVKTDVQDAAGEEKPEPRPFTPYKPPRRRPGTGCVSQLGDHLWEGRYSPGLARWQKARPKCIRQNGSRVRGEIEGTDPGDEEGDCAGEEGH